MNSLSATGPNSNLQEEEEISSLDERDLTDDITGKIYEDTPIDEFTHKLGVPHEKEDEFCYADSELDAHSEMGFEEFDISSSVEGSIFEDEFNVDEFQTTEPSTSRTINVDPDTLTKTRTTSARPPNLFTLPHTPRNQK